MSTINSAIYVLFSAFVEVYSRDFKLSTPFKDEILPKISNLDYWLYYFIYLIYMKLSLKNVIFIHEKGIFYTLYILSNF